MQTLAIIGAQWGDEGKGKITDTLGAKADLVVRFQGGNNAGHTIIVGDKKTVLHLIPSGILHAHCTSVIGHGLVFDPVVFKQEFDEVSQSCSITPKNLRISDHAAVITSYDKILDAAREKDSNIGTTKRGIGPAYESKISRQGLKLKDLLDKNRLHKKLSAQLQERSVLFKQHYQVDFPIVEEEVSRLFELGTFLKPFLTDTFSLLDQSLQQGKKVLYEGAQGVLLDIDYGTYPYVTSSNTSIGAIYTGAGCPGHHVEEALGITKAYTTRVGEGPFPTELLDEEGDALRNKGGEFGATTGRPRRCGWLDLPLLKYAIKASGFTSLALTKLDILAGLEGLKVCYAYIYEGQEIDCAHPGLDLTQVQPLYKEMPTFHDTFKDSNWSSELQTYLEFIEKTLEVPIGILAYGPERSQISLRKEYF